MFPKGSSLTSSERRADAEAVHRFALTHSEAASAWLDAIRWIAALAVLLTHVQNRMLLRVHEAGQTGDASNQLHIAFAFLSGFGRQAVLTFFVLSGYLVGGGCIRALRKGNFDPTDYAVKRLTRLTVVLVPALVATLLINSYLIRYGAPYMDDAFRQNMLEGTNASTLICNILYFQTALCPTYGGNGSLWSLFNEFWYYVVAGLLACAVKFNAYSIAFLSFTLLLGLTTIQIEHNLLVFFILWCLGALAAVCPRLKWHIPKYLAFLLYVSAFLADRILLREAFNEDHPLLRIFADYAIALTLCLFLVSLRDNRSAPFFPPGRPRLHQELAAFSFSLYCLNAPLINLFATLSEAWMGVGWREHPAQAPSIWGIIAACTTATIAVSFAFSLATERQMPALRRVLGRRP